MHSGKQSPILWHGTDVIQAIQGKGPHEWSATGISIDTRTLNPGDIFIALRGPTHDGHRFIDQALSLGASAVIGQDLLPGMNPEKPMVCVPNTTIALNQLATAARHRFQGKILALTGSVGKTSVKDGLRHVLSQQRSTSASLHSLNNHWGVPLSLARLPQDAQWAIFEIGMNHAGEIAQLVRLIDPHVALITQVSYQHGDFFNDLNEIISAKAEIFSSSGPLVGILNRDGAHYASLKNQGDRVKKWITF